MSRSPIRQAPTSRCTQPLNYDRKFDGPVTLRRALEDSRNIPAVKAMEELGPRQVVAYARRFGLGDSEPYLSLALGASEATLVDITSAYSAFVNHGVRMTPYSVVTVTDRDGNLLEEHRPEPHEAIRADTAFVMTNLLRGVVQRGTAASAAALDWPLGGKTGTMDEYTDAWFVGFDPNITVGVWVGYDEKKSLGSGETGASAALPIWIDFMRAYIDTRGDRKNPPTVRAAREHRVPDARFRRPRSVHQRYAAAGTDRARRTSRGSGGAGCGARRADGTRRAIGPRRRGRPRRGLTQTREGCRFRQSTYPSYAARLSSRTAPIATSASTG